MSEELARTCARLASDRKALDPRILDLRERSPFTDFFVLASGRSDRQVKAIVEGVVEGLKADGIRPMGVEGESRGEWVLIDYGDVVVHVFYAPLREHYDLESLWSDAPVLPVEDLEHAGS